MADNISESQTYAGSCHCGANRFSVVVSPPLSAERPLVHCNCSICYINGYLMVHVPAAAVTLETDEDRIKTYSFGEKRVEHYFCPTCGTSLFVRATKTGFFFEGMKAVNLRTLKDVDINALKFKEVDGKSY